VSNIIVTLQVAVARAQRRAAVRFRRDGASGFDLLTPSRHCCAGVECFSFDNAILVLLILFGRK
jgi:hypothetical protein